MLIQSDWARRYSTRAIAVIAMFDPDYESNPAAAERKVPPRFIHIARTGAAPRA